VIFDNRGVGKSDTPPGSYTVAQMAQDSFAVLDAVGIDSCHICGSSLGGAIGLQMALDAPSRILSLQLHSSWLGTHGYTEYSLGLLRKILVLGGVDFYYEATLPLLFSAAFLSSDYDRTADMLTRMRANAASYDGLLAQIDANLSYDLRAKVDSVTVPTLITVGELDILLPTAASEELHRALPNSELVVLPNAAHLASMEASDAFNAVVVQFMNKVAGL
jgi:aminoacrylate hydrolase